MTDECLTFKDMCLRFDVTPRTLRYYEYIELLTPPRQGRTRVYGPREVARMTLILRGRKFGFALEDIRQWLQLYDREGTEAQMRRWVLEADRQLLELDAQKRQLTATMTELRALRDAVAESLATPPAPAP